MTMRTFRVWSLPVLAVLVALAAAPTADAAERMPPGFAAGTPGRVVQVTDGDTLVLADGREVRLVGIQAPKLPLGRAGFPIWPLAPEARAALGAMAMGRTLTPWFGGARRDRHGRLLAQLTRADGLWLQGEMLARGLARVYSFADNRKGIAAMYAIERTARAARRGIWALPYYRVLKDTEAGRHIGTFQLIEGRIRAVAVVHGRGYLNFGEDWRRDFTVIVPKAALAIFRAAFGRSLGQLSGRPVRVRGWLRSYDGPMIEATHPEQIEVLQ